MYSELINVNTTTQRLTTTLHHIACLLKCSCTTRISHFGCITNGVNECAGQSRKNQERVRWCTTQPSGLCAAVGRDPSGGLLQCSRLVSTGQQQGCVYCHPGSSPRSHCDVPGGPLFCILPHIIARHKPGNPTGAGHAAYTSKHTAQVLQCSI
jgi:hypothetical protein